MPKSKNLMCFETPHGTHRKHEVYRPHARANSRRNEEKVGETNCKVFAKCPNTFGGAAEARQALPLSCAWRRKCVTSGSFH